uniref:Uncharacterized protein n=1 Tax=Cucumis melo TaxID=3656 RepID=A0A9I9EBX1_CUCME
LLPPAPESFHHEVPVRKIISDHRRFPEPFNPTIHLRELADVQQFHSRHFLNHSQPIRNRAERQIRHSDLISSEEFPLSAAESPLLDESSSGSLVRIGRQQGILRPRFFDIFENDNGFTDRVSGMDEDWNLLMNGIVLQKERRFVGEIFFNVFVGNAFECQSPNDSVTERAWPSSMEFQFFHLLLQWRIRSSSRIEGRKSLL